MNPRGIEFLLVVVVRICTLSASPFPNAVPPPTMSSRKLLGLAVGVVGLGLRLAAAEVPPVPQAPDDPRILAVAQSSTGFAADLYSRLRTRPGNFTIAPLGLAQALLPIAAGSRGTAGEELAAVLHLSVAPAEAADGCTILTQRLERAAGGEDGLAFARALWVRPQNAIDTDFVELLRQRCACELRVIDFGQGDHAIHWMNRWISARTGDRILAIADATTLEPDANLVVGAAVYFDGEWQDAFDPTLTVMAPFHLPGSTPVAGDKPAAPATQADPLPAADATVATEPAAALCLKHEYPQLLDDDDARFVADNTSEACSYLWNMHTRGQLQLDLRPVSALLGYHQPCHLRALEAGSPGEQLLGLIPGLRLRDIEAGCCGMAGTFGLMHKNYRNSLRAGWKLISRLRNPDLLAGVTECSACKLQMEQGAAKPTFHPIELLALAYGLMPEIGGLFGVPRARDGIRR